MAYNVITPFLMLKVSLNTLQNALVIVKQTNAKNIQFKTIKLFHQSKSFMKVNIEVRKKKKAIAYIYTHLGFTRANYIKSPCRPSTDRYCSHNGQNATSDKHFPMTTVT